jgi:hypothetical protein
MSLTKNRLSLEEYEKRIKILSYSKSKVIFKNSSHEHASIVLSYLLKTSKEEVCIYDDDLSGDIAEQSVDNKLLTSFTEYIKSKKRLKIVINFLGKKNKFQTTLLSLQDSYPETFQIKKANNDFIKEVENCTYSDLNFAIGDKSKFRIEYGQRGERKALCSFNSESNVQLFRPIFDRFFNNLETIKD